MIKRLNKILTDKYSCCIQPLAEISYDERNKEALCSSENAFFCYDSIIQKQYPSNHPATPDMIYFADDVIKFVEFKNGNIYRDEDIRKIKLKGIEGCFIALYDMVQMNGLDWTFADIVNLQKVYVVVYNSEKINPDNNQRTAKAMRHLKASEVLFGLNKYKGTFFDDVITISENKFISDFLPKLKALNLTVQPNA